MSGPAQVNPNGNICGDNIVGKTSLISNGTLKVSGMATIAGLNTALITSPGGTNLNGVTFQNSDVTIPGNLSIGGIMTTAKNLSPQDTLAQRREDAYTVRAKASYNEYLTGVNQNRQENGDESLYPNKISNFSKGLPHDSLGVVDSTSYNKMLYALQTQAPSDFDQIPLGGVVKLTNPQAALAYDLEGADVFATNMVPSPTFSSAQWAGEAVELYNMAIMRDVNFSDYGTSPLATSACTYLNALTDFRGPKQASLVTPATLFRGSLNGCVTGPYVSQFLYQTFHYGAVPIIQKSRKTTVGADYLTDFPTWLSVRNGAPTTQPSWPDVRYMINARDLAEWVHMDALYQGYHHALLYLLGINCPLNVGNPYNNNTTQAGFGTFGGAHILALLPEVSARALKAAWNQKWTVHRRARPEEYCGRVHLTKTGQASDPLSSDVLNSGVLADVFTKWGSYLLPQSYVEGCPTHPSYPAGHATVAGACVTLLKAWFNTTGNVPNPVQPSSDGSTLVPYVGTLNIQDELHKLACNIATGRNMAGIHYRSDMDESLILGEEICISVLRDQKLTYNENFAGFTFQKFDGTMITV
jgi:hypothetical protein